MTRSGCTLRRYAPRGGTDMTTRYETTALEELKGVRRALLNLTQALLHVASATIATAAGATFALVEEALERVRKQGRKNAA